MTAAYKEIAEIKFEPVPELEGIDHEAKLSRVACAARIAIGLLGKSKESLIEFIRNSDKDKSEESIAATILVELDDGLKKLGVITDFVIAARLRIASAAAVVYPEKPRRRKRTA
jgi:hypothetical protein